MSDNKSCFPWPRYWFPEGSSDYGTFIQHGYLTLPPPEHSLYFSTVPSQLTDLTQTPVLILLGEPGYGKSQSLIEERNRLNSEQADDLVIFCDLKTFGSGDQQSLQHYLLDQEKLRLVEQGQRLWVLLDGLDECMLPTPADWLIREFINKISNPERVFVRITCRASSWPELLEKAFLERWSSVTNEPVKIWRLCPLREEDVSTAAQVSQINAEEFLSAIAERNVEELAALPVTLRFMLKLFRQNQLPQQRTETFEKGLKLLCEDSPERRKSQKKSHVSTDTRFLAASKMALGYILHGCNGIWHGPGVDCPQGLFTTKEIVGTENYNDIQHTLDELAINETLELTGVFARLDLHRFQFASRTFAEFLAAWYIAKSTVPTLQKLKVVLHPESRRLIPDLYETAAWLAAIEPQFLAWLVTNEPYAALEADFATLAQGDLPALVDGLLALAAKEERPSYDKQRLSKLKYPGIESKLISLITDCTRPIASRALAIRIANACELQVIGLDLADLALNEQEDFSLRKLAVFTLEDMDDIAKTRLIPIAESDQALKAIALSILGPRLMGAEAFFKQISPTYLETVPSTLGYDISKDSFLSVLDADGLVIGLRWIAAHAPIGYDRFTTNRLKSRLLARAFNYLDEPSVVKALVGAMKALHSHYESFFDGLERDEPQNPFDDAEKRRIVLLELISQIDLNKLNTWIFSGESCIREEDCMWLLKQFDQTSSEDKRHLIASVINTLIQYRPNREVVEEVLNRVGVTISNPDPILAEHLAWQFCTMDLTNETTINCRKQYFEHQDQMQELQNLTRKNKEARQSQCLQYSPEAYIQTNLADCEAGNFNHWPDLVASLALQENGSQVFPHEPDSLPGWQKADDALRNRIVTVAISYLEQAAPPDDSVLMQNSRTINDVSGALAIAILAITNNLDRIPKEQLSRWCMEIVTHFFDQHETKEFIFRQARSIAPEAFDHAVLKVVDQEAEAGNISLLQSCRAVWHPDFLQQLASTRLNTQNWKFSSRLRLAELLISSNFDNIINQVMGWLASEPEADNRCAAANTLFQYAPAQAWVDIQQILTEDKAFARKVILAIAHSSGYSGTIYSKLDAGQLGWLYDTIRNLFPPTEDPPIPDHVYSPTPRHDTSNIRDGLIGQLRLLATPEAIKELDRICTAYPDTPWLVRARADAYNGLWRRERTRISFSETIKLLSDANSTVVRNSRELMIVIEEALQRFAHEAQHGSPPLAVFLWNEKQKTHFSEQRLSDFLKFYLDREWRGRRIIINREVEIRNLRDFGIGERTDLLIQTITSNSDAHQPQLCVVIEVKVDKNVKPEDIPEQLVGKYLDGESRASGIYLVGWFGKSRDTIEKLRENAVQCAEDNTTDRIKVNSLILDLSHPLQ